MYFHFVNSLGENLLQVLSGDLVEIVFFFPIEKKIKYNGQLTKMFNGA